MWVFFPVSVILGQVFHVISRITDFVASEIQVEILAGSGAIIIRVYPAISRCAGFWLGKIVMLHDGHIVVARVIFNNAIGVNNNNVVAFCLAKAGAGIGVLFRALLALLRFWRWWRQHFFRAFLPILFRPFDRVDFLPLSISEYQPLVIDIPHRVVPDHAIQVQPINRPRRVGTDPALQPRCVIPMPVVIQPAGIAFLAGVANGPVVGFHGRTGCHPRGSSVGQVTFLADQVGLIVELQ
ncbi:hypothetical protein D3C76_1039450 [compost metagenome]